jgi:hypothetical protein
MRKGALPEAVIVRTEGSKFGHGCVVTLAEAGIGWECQDIEGAHWVPWPLLGGLSDSSGGGGWARMPWLSMDRRSARSSGWS